MKGGGVILNYGQWGGRKSKFDLSTNQLPKTVYKDQRLNN